MGYFEGLADASFKQDAQGNNIFYPWGVLGKGRILPDETTKISLRKFIILYYQISLPTLLLLTLLRMWWLLVVIGFVLFAWFYLHTKLITKDCAISNEKLTLKESYKNSADGHNKYMLWLMLLASLVFVVGGVFMFFKGKLFIGLGAVVFFGLCSAVFIFMLKAKR